MNEKKPLPKLTRKQAAFVRELVENPKISATEAAARTYNVTTRHSAENMANQNLGKREIQSHLESYSDLVENTLTDTVRDWGRAENTRKREIAQTAAMYIHDKVHGKATQRVEATTTAVTIAIDLSAKHGDVIESE